MTHAFTTIALIGGFLTSLAVALLVAWVVASEVYTRWTWHRRQQQISAARRASLERYRREAERRVA